MIHCAFIKKGRFCNLIFKMCPLHFSFIQTVAVIYCRRIITQSLSGIKGLLWNFPAAQLLGNIFSLLPFLSLPVRLHYVSENKNLFILRREKKTHNLNLCAIEQFMKSTHGTMQVMMVLCVHCSVFNVGCEKKYSLVKLPHIWSRKLAHFFSPLKILKNNNEKRLILLWRD